MSPCLIQLPQIGLLRLLLLGAGLLLLTGCVSMPPRVEHDVDQNTPEFQAALAREIERLEAEGVRDLVARATRNVVGAFEKAEEARESELLALLVEALEALENPHGCWAYTVTTLAKGKFPDREGSGYKMESFDPSKPIETAWTLLNKNGITPDEEQQSEYRREKVSAWQRQLRARDTKWFAEHFLAKTRMGRQVAFDVQEEDGRLIYGFETPRMSVPLLARLEGVREEHVIDQATGELRSSRIWTLGPLVRLAARIDHAELRTEYTTIYPGLPPFRFKVWYQLKELEHGKEYDFELERVYANYRRVTCYDERFQVEIPELEVLDFLPNIN